METQGPWQVIKNRKEWREGAKGREGKEGGRRMARPAPGGGGG